jgi:hypothetical protein
MPIAPVQAATFGANCLFFPLLQADCRDAISDAIQGTSAAVTAAAVTTSSAVTAEAPDFTDPKRGPRIAFWWAQSCTAAPAGSGHLLDC